MSKKFVAGDHIFVAGTAIKATTDTGEPLMISLVKNLTDIALHAKRAVRCGDGYAEVQDHATQLWATVEILKLMEPPKKEPKRALSGQGETEGGAS